MPYPQQLYGMHPSLSPTPTTNYPFPSIPYSLPELPTATTANSDPSISPALASVPFTFGMAHGLAMSQPLPSPAPAYNFQEDISSPVQMPIVLGVAHSPPSSATEDEGEPPMKRPCMSPLTSDEFYKANGRYYGRLCEARQGTHTTSRYGVPPYPISVNQANTVASSQASVSSSLHQHASSFVPPPLQFERIALESVQPTASGSNPHSGSRATRRWVDDDRDATAVAQQPPAKRRRVSVQATPTPLPSTSASQPSPAGSSMSSSSPSGSSPSASSSSSHVSPTSSTSPPPSIHASSFTHLPNGRYRCKICIVPTYADTERDIVRHLDLENAKAHNPQRVLQCAGIRFTGALAPSRAFWERGFRRTPVDVPTPEKDVGYQAVHFGTLFDTR